MFSFETVISESQLDKKKTYKVVELAVPVTLHY